MEDLAAELVFFITTFLTSSDVVSLACTCRDLFEKTLGDEYCKSYVQSQKGLRFCCLYGTLLSIRLCLKDPNFDPKAEEDCMNDAALREPEVMQLLLEDGRLDPMAGKLWCVNTAAVTNPKVLKLLLADERVKRMYNYNTCLLGAAANNSESFRILLRDGRVDFNDRVGFHSLRIAIDTKMSDVICMILQDKRFSIENPEFFLFRAVRMGLDTLKLFLEDERFEAFKALQIACDFETEESLQIVKYLLESGKVQQTLGMAPFSQKQKSRPTNPLETTLLSWQAVIMRPKLLKIFLEDGRCDPRDTDATRLWVCALRNLESFKLLLQDGRADPSSPEVLDIWQKGLRNSDHFNYLLRQYDPKFNRFPPAGSITYYCEIFEALLDDGRVDLFPKGCEPVVIYVDTESRLLRLLVRQGFMRYVDLAYEKVF